jgi:hypothetical protein
VAGISNPGCYARCLGDCSEDLTREHYFSESILEHLNRNRDLLSRGMPGLGSRPRLGIPPKALAARVLCGRHNAALSPLDETGLRFFRLFVERSDDLATDGPMNTRSRVRGNDIELWMLKCLCGFMAAGGATTAAGEPVPLEPPPAWVRILFGCERMPYRWGMYFIGEEQGRPLKNGESLFVGPIFLNDDISVDACLGGKIEVHDLAFGLLMRPPPPEHIALKTWMSPAWYRLTEILFRNETTFREHAVQLSWSPKEKFAKSVRVRRVS